MNLPFVLDVATGLIFIYLILSLLASEIQELIATLLQWRAKHLKRSIETLIAGGSKDVEDVEIDKVKQLTSLLYNDPLINTLNFEEKGFLGSLARKFFRFFESKFEVVFNKANRKLNGHEANVLSTKNSAPSYIPNETFATTLLEALRVPDLVREIGQESLESFQQKQVSQIEAYLQPINEEQSINEDIKLICQQEFQELNKSFEEISQNFQSRITNLKSCIIRMGERLDHYIETVQDILPDSITKRRLIRQLKLLRKDTFSNTAEAVLQGGVQPNLAQILNGYKQVKDGLAEPNNPIHQKIKSLKLKGSHIEENLIDRLPKSLTDSLAVLAERAEIKINDAEEGVNQFKQEVETWFDRSMERASGVYKRNSKGVAIIIGFLIAVVANADTLHIVSRLSKDTALRTAITQNSNQAAENCPTSSDNLNCILDKVDRTLTDVSLPVGWTDYNTSQQLGANLNAPGKPQAGIWPILRIISGWILSSIAIAMGAPFWFDLLGRIVNVRNTGRKPNSPPE